MIRGMTGFGSATFSDGKVKGVIEIKSQNHRYFDIVFYLPIGFASIENKIRQMVNQSIARGRVTVSLKITEKPVQQLTFNKNAVKEYFKYAKILQKEYGLKNDLSLSDLIKLSGVIGVNETILTGDELWPAVVKGLKRAEASLVRMRAREGESLAVDGNSVLKRMLLQIKKVESRAVAVLKEKKKQLSPDEFLSFQKGSDVNEETTRLKHYIEEFRLLLKATVSVGKKLDFVAQEMQRETNTIGAKLQDQVASNAVIALKSKIEKLREQAQNIE